MSFVCTIYRWGNTPHDDAVRFGHADVAELIQTYIDEQTTENNTEEVFKANEEDTKSETQKK